ncbi:MAG: phosphomannomutase/phosphoglucomutase [Candidatus Cloacimonetes bacterium]|nr:phosphomannomutase/phosphoglucomutase [Candidatus Cloacimonadota bacterium]
MINRQIFRQYDIRGIVNIDLNDETVYLLGRGFGTFLRQRNLRSVVIGGDARISTPRFKKQFSTGLLDCGCEVIDVAILATPTLYFSIHHLKADAGVMITGSHNPPEYNGFKLNIGLTSIYGDDILEIYDIIQNNTFIEGSGALRTVHGMIKIYQDYLVEISKIDRPVKVIVDAGNGAGGPILPDILRRLGCEVIELYCDMDGTYPNHHPDPTILEYMQDLVRTVKNTKAEVGIGLDGDADRIGVIDETGNMLFGDQILNIFAREFLKENPGEKVVADVKCSKNLFDDIKKQGGIPVMYKTGHSLIKKKMKEDKIIMGGEMSGHIIFEDRYLGFDDAIYAACRFVEIIAKSDKKVSEMLADQPKMYNTPEMRVDCTEDNKFQIVELVKNHFQEKGFDVNDIDGMRVTFPDGWGLLRASNTQPVLVTRFEAETEARLQEIKDLVEQEIDRVKKELE